MDRRLFLASPLALAAVSAAPVQAADAPAATFLEPSEWIDLWPKDASSDMPIKPTAVFSETVTATPDKWGTTRRMKGITRPRLAVFRPQTPNGSAILISPGGGFSLTSFDHEGYRLADRLTKDGITCFVLFYRLANDGWADRLNVGTVDAQRGMRVLRANAARFGVDPARVAAIGFSAGGFITASLATQPNAALVPAQDPIDALDARPAVAALMYGVISVDPAIAYRGAAPSLFQRAPTDAEVQASPERRVTATTPPTFLCHTDDDTTVPPENSLRFRAALKAQKIPVETHLFAAGGHGFGMRPDTSAPYHAWPGLLVAFLRSQSLFT